MGNSLSSIFCRTAPTHFCYNEPDLEMSTISVHPSSASTTPVNFIRLIAYHMAGFLYILDITHDSNKFTMGTHIALFEWCYHEERHGVIQTSNLRPSVIGPITQIARVSYHWVTFSIFDKGSNQTYYLAVPRIRATISPISLLAHQLLCHYNLKAQPYNVEENIGDVMEKIAQYPSDGQWFPQLASNRSSR
jgi:hypothetical protein